MRERTSFRGVVDGLRPGGHGGGGGGSRRKDAGQRREGNERVWRGWREEGDKRRNFGGKGGGRRGGKAKWLLVGPD